ncbi:MAG: ABC transporter permease [Gemmatimonadota bacterium]
MNKVFAVIRREFIERVRTRAFLIATLLGPLFFIGISVLPALLLRRESVGRRVVIVNTTSGDFGARIEAALAAAKKGTGSEAVAKYKPVRIDAASRGQEVRDSLVHITGLSKQAEGGVDGILIVDESGITTGKLTYLGANVGSPRDMDDLRQVLNPVVITERLRRAGVDPVVAMGAATPLALETRKVSEGQLTNESGGATFALAYGMSFILYIALLLYGTQVMTSVIEEKSNRIMEVLMSSLTPFQLLLGKVVGVGLVSLLQIGIWTTAAKLLRDHQSQIMRAFGASGDAAGFSLPAMSIELLAVFITFFVLGFLLYSAAYAAVGSMCNTVQETQQAQMPIMLFIIFGLMSMFALLNEPNGSLAKALSLVPPLAPFVVPVRYSIAPIPLPSLLLYVATTILGLLAIVWIAARIYRVGILSYGKKASFKDMARWIRAS